MTMQDGGEGTRRLEERANKLLAKITPGSWEYDEMTHYGESGTGYGRVWYRDERGDAHVLSDEYMDEADAQFIAAAPQLVRDLLAALVTARARVAALQPLVEQWRARATEPRLNTMQARAFRVCADELAAALSLGLPREPPTRQEGDDNT